MDGLFHGKSQCLQRDFPDSIAGYPMGIGPGWWFGTFFIFPYSGNNNPN